MKDLMSSTNFYIDVVHSDKPLNEIFQTLAMIGTTTEFRELFEKYFEKLEEEFPAINDRSDFRKDGLLTFPENIEDRIRVSILTLMNIGVEGIEYNEELLERGQAFINELNETDHFDKTFLSQLFPDNKDEE